MLQKVIWQSLNALQRSQVLMRPVMKNRDIANITAQIIAQVRQGGDQALRQLTAEYDKVQLTDLAVTAEEFQQANIALSAAAKAALKKAAANIRSFHQAQSLKDISVTTTPGIICELQYRPIPRVGLYVPGGTAPLPSAVLMLAIPAAIAGCSERVLCTPPSRNGNIDPHILFAAQLCGIEKVYKIGGAQAVAAMAYGTESVPKVDKIYGPGNAWVTQAKLLVSRDLQGAACDMPAGPSEQMVIADKTANPQWAAADLLSQAEHGSDSQVMLVTDDAAMLNAVIEAVQTQVATLPRRSICETALQHSYAILVPDLTTAFAVANEYAPEHLLLQIAEPRRWMQKIHHAGSVFLGHWTTESMGDYASGTNHVLPTYGLARSYSGLSLADFMKRITFQEATAAGMNELGPTVALLAEIEGLVAHQRAVTIRLNSEEKFDEKLTRISTS